MRTATALAPNEPALTFISHVSPLSYKKRSSGRIELDASLSSLITSAIEAYREEGSGGLHEPVRASIGPTTETNRPKDEKHFGGADERSMER